MTDRSGEHQKYVTSWMSREPLGALGLDGPNLYQYVQNNPLNLVDHTGLSATSPEPLVMIGEVDLPGGALERAGRIINAGDRMAEELIKRSKPGFFQRCQEGFRSALDVPAKVVKLFGWYDSAKTGVERTPNVTAVGASIYFTNKARDAALEGDWESYEKYAEKGREASRLSEKALEMCD